MIHLFERSGSSELELLDLRFADAEWSRLRRVAADLLERRGALEAAEDLRTLPLELREGTNGFGDEFNVLYMKARVPDYVRLAELADDRAARGRFAAIAEAVTEVGGYVRFVTVELDDSDGPEPVSTPVLAITSDTVERALRDAERLLASEGATSGVDRVHTAFHGYLLQVATRAGIEFDAEAGLTEVLKLIRERHPAFAEAGPRRHDVEKILRSAASVADALNPIRNKASVAHPNEDLLGEPEAMLVINVVRSLLHYLNDRTRA